MGSLCDGQCLCRSSCPSSLQHTVVVAGTLDTPPFHILRNPHLARLSCS